MLDQLKELGFHSEDIILHVINAVILFLIVRGLAYKPLRRFMQARTARIAASLDEAAQAHTEALQLRGEYEAKIAAAENTARTRALEITAAANESARGITDTAERESLALLNKARAKAEAEQSQTLAGLQNEIAELSIGIAEQILRREVNNADAMALTRDAMAQMLVHSNAAQEGSGQ
ncbi:MAG: ATP synthase F0 subunit B [Oscillospiraceae bacterium]|jgi:F-type H+-transporting ATPase subunit b|nr:ATP synthase F0 subunit B [Oscillospiraceae bacterium]